jgi:hypothetical protein
MRDGQAKEGTTLEKEPISASAGTLPGRHRDIHLAVATRTRLSPFPNLTIASADARHDHVKWIFRWLLDLKLPLG